MDYLKEILDDAEKVRQIVSDVSCNFESELHDDAWLSLYLLAELNESNTKDLIGSSELSEALRIGKLIRECVHTQAVIDAALAEDAAIEKANEDRAEAAWALNQTRNCA